jgi:aminopeptidase-like protein
MYEDIVEAIESQRIPQSLTLYDEPCISALDLPGFHSGGAYRPSVNQSKSYLQILDLCDGQQTEAEIVTDLEANPDSIKMYHMMLRRGVISYV